MAGVEGSLRLQGGPTCPALAAGSRRSSGCLCAWPQAAPGCRAASAAWSACKRRATHINFSNCGRADANANVAKGHLTGFSGCSSAAPGPTSADLVPIQPFSTPTKPERGDNSVSPPEGLNRAEELWETAKVPWKGEVRVGGAAASWYLGEEDSVAPGAGLKSKNQTLVRSVEGEGQVRQQAALVLHEERGQAAGVLATRQHLRSHPHRKAEPIPLHEQPELPGCRARCS